jgi:cytochrome b561
MEMRNTQRHWGIVHQSLHWLIAALVITQLILGFIFADLADNSPERPSTFHAHATLGLTILVLFLVRLWWRRTNAVPTLPDTLSPWQKQLAHANHYMLYIVLIAMPIVGYLLANAGGHTVPFYNLHLPAIIGKDQGLAQTLWRIHAWSAYTILLLLTLHVLAALRHEYVLKDNTLRRMTPLPARHAPTASAGRDGGPRTGAGTSTRA